MVQTLKLDYALSLCCTHPIRDVVRILRTSRRMQTTTVRLCYIARIERGYYWDTLYTSVCIDPFRRAGSGDPSRTSIPKLLGEIRLIRCCTLYPVSVT